MQDNEEPNARAAAQIINGKPVLPSNSRILNRTSKFKEKRLCDGPTFSPGTACVYSCTYCFVVPMFSTKPFVQEVLMKTRKSFQEVVIRRNDAAGRLRRELQSCRSLKDQDLVIYGSPVVDVAATLELAHETIDMCCTILEETRWTVRLLSKSPLLAKVARGIPGRWQSRVIYGLSTGTLDDTIARAIEPDAPPPSKRLEALKQIQEDGFRTYAMLCPVLPPAQSGEENEAAAKAFVAEAAERINFQACENVWSEAINEKGGTFDRVIAGLQRAEQRALAIGQQRDVLSLRNAAARLESVRDKKAWEDYARTLFLALAERLPPGKLRFLQYPSKSTADWWIARKDAGAIPLIKLAETKAAVADPELARKRSEAAQMAWRTIRAKRLGAQVDAIPLASRCSS